MTCREFEHFCSARQPADWPPAARAHLSSCPACAARVGADTAADAALRRLGAIPPRVDADAACVAIRQAIEQQSTETKRADWRRPFVFAVAGLAAISVLAALLAWPAIYQRWHSHVIARSVPSPRLQITTSRTGTPHEQPPQPRGTDNGNVPPRSPKAGELPPVNEAPLAPAPGPDGGNRPKRPKLTFAPHGRPLPVEKPNNTPDDIPSVFPRSPRNALREVSSADLLFLNEGPLAAARPYAPPPASLPHLPELPPVQARKPGSVVVDDLLNLNPVRLAGLGDAGLGAALRTIAAEEPATDPRLQQQVYVHATMQRLGELLGWLSKATGVTLLARLEVADEKASLWADDRTLMDVMRDLRHLRGYYWSRSKRADQYVYSLWQDAQSRAREQAEIQRPALEKQRQFAEDIQKHVKALKASDAELKRLAQDDPYLAVQMLHPVVRNGYQLFAALAPDQQAQLLQGQTPSRALSGGEILKTFPLASKPGDKWSDSPEYLAGMAPLGDIVTLKRGEMTPEQRAAVAAIVKGTVQAQQRAYQEIRQRDPSEAHQSGYLEWHTKALAAADLGTATVSLFRWGDPDFPGLSLRVDVQSGGRGWGIYSNIGLPPGAEKGYNDWIRQGKLRLVPGVRQGIEKYLDRKGKREQTTVNEAALKPGESPDPILDASISLTWKLALREGAGEQRYSLNSVEVLAALSRDLRRPLVLDPMPIELEQPRSGSAEFRWEKRPLRELLHRLFPGWPCHTEGGAIFISKPDAPHHSLNEVPPAVERFLKARQGPFTLDDMAFLVRSLSPWQIVKLEQYLPDAAIDQTLALQDLLRLYGELAPAQRAALPQGVAYANMTPAQQALFLAFAQRQHPFVEPWRFQNGVLRVTQESASSRRQWDNAFRLSAQAEFAVRFQDDDAARFPLELVGKPKHDPWRQTVADLVGHPFPGFRAVTWHHAGAHASDPIHQPSLTDARLQGKAAIIVISRPFAEPYAGIHPQPASAAWTRDLAARLRGSRMIVVHELLGPRDATLALPGTAPIPNLVNLWDEGDANAQPFDSYGGGEHIDQSPTVFVVGRDGIVRATFEGQDAWDAAAVERAARHLISAPAGTQNERGRP